MQLRLKQLVLTSASLLLMMGVARAVCLEGNVSVAPGNVPVGREYQQSQYVLIATVKSESAVPEGRVPGDLEGTDYHVAPTVVFKGAPPSDLALFSENSSGRFPMEIGSQYLLFVLRAGSNYAVDNCGNSGLLASTAGLIDLVRRLQTGR